MIRFESEPKLRQQAEELLQSPTHDIDHTDQIITFGLSLLEKHGGDSEVLIAAAYLHDLARNDPQSIGGESALESARLARPLLEEVGFPGEKIDKVCQVIAEHDQPDMGTTSIEAQILKEADFLAGFGAWGILRSLVWSGERGEQLEETLRRLREKMPARIESLRFPESREFARKKNKFVRLFLALLEEPVSLETEPLPGKYLIFEGTSGAGKETQAKLLTEELRKRGEQVVLVYEPTPDLKPILRSWREEIDDHIMELFIFVADRRRIMKRDVFPALKEGKTVISIRSFISTEVYETENEQEEALVDFLHTFVPDWKSIIWLDVSPKEAYRRIMERDEVRGKYENFERLKRDRSKYKKVLASKANVTAINGSPSTEEVHQAVIKALESQGAI